MNANPKGARVRRRERWSRAYSRIVYFTASTRCPTYTITGRVTSRRADEIPGEYALYSIYL